MTRFVLATIFAIAPAAMAQSLAGLWDATITANGRDIPFRMQFSGEGQKVTGYFFNGDERVASTSGSFENGSLTVIWDYFANKLTATWKDGTLEGTYTGARHAPYPFKAKRFVPPSLTQGDVPSIAGLWEIPAKSAKAGELAWRFIVRQSGPEVSAAILRVDGDTGSIEGTYKDGKFVLSHFGGDRPMLLEVTLEKDGTLKLLQNGRTEMIAFRSADARAKGLPEPADPSRHTSVKDPTEPFHFSFPDLNGKIVSDTDARFQNKVVIVAIGGSWCPNCHDEAPFLVELYRKYHSRGLEIVSLMFEEEDQLKDPVRLRAFIKKYGIEFPVLLCGQQSDLSAKVPQGVNLDSWPTTFYLGRDGRVRSVHAGFASAASGEFNTALREEAGSLIERLLAERVSESASAR
jgi:thiol-disulfide isomerase/thioredoxin